MYQYRELFDIHDCIENALSTPILSVESAELTPIGTIAGQFIDSDRTSYQYEIGDEDILYARTDSIRTDALPPRRGKKCPGGYTIPANKNCRQASMTPSAKAKGASVKSSLAAGAAKGGSGTIAKLAAGAAIAGGAAAGANAMRRKAPTASIPTSSSAQKMAEKEEEDFAKKAAQIIAERRARRGQSSEDQAAGAQAAVETIRQNRNRRRAA